MATIAKLVIEAALDTKGIYRGAQRTQDIVTRMMTGVARANTRQRFFPLGEFQDDIGRAANFATQELQRKFDGKRLKLMERALADDLSPAQLHKQFDKLDQAYQGRLRDLRRTLLRNPIFAQHQDLVKPIVTNLNQELDRVGKNTQDLARSLVAAQTVHREALQKYSNSRQQIRQDLVRGLVRPEEASKAAAFAAKSFNDDLVKGIDELKARSLLSPAAEAHLVKQFKTAGIRAGEAAANEARRAFQTKWRNASMAATSVGRDMSMFVTLPIVGAMGLAVKTMHDFEFAINRVQGYTGATNNQMAGLVEQARQLGATTEFTAAQVADAYVEMSKAGFTLEQQLSAMPEVLKLAAAGGFDLATATDISSSILQAAQVPYQQFGEAVDMLVKTFTSAKVELTDLGVSFRYVGAIAAQSGMEFSETAAVLAILARAGLRGSMAGTALRGALSRLLTPTKRAAAIMDDLGIKVLDNNKEMLPFINILEQMRSKGVSTAQILEIFGDRAGPGMAVLISQGTEALAQLESQIRNNGDIADRVANKMMSGLRGAWLEAKSAAEEFAIAIGESGVLELVTKLALGLRWLFISLAELPPQWLRVITGAAGLLAVLGPLVYIMGQLMRAIYLVNRANIAFVAGIAKHPILIAAAAAAAAIYVFWLRRKRDEMEETAEAMQQYAESLTNLNKTAVMAQFWQQFARESELIAERQRILSEAKKQQEGLARLGILDTNPTGMDPKQQARLEEISGELEIIQGRYEAIRNRLQELAQSEAITADLANALQEAWAEFDGMLNTDINADPLQKLRDRVSEAIARLEFFRSRGMETTAVMADIASAAGEVNKQIAAGGGYLKANTELLRMQQELHEAAFGTASPVERAMAGFESKTNDLIAQLEVAIGTGSNQWQKYIKLNEDWLSYLEGWVDTTDGISTLEQGIYEQMTSIRSAIEAARNALQEAGLAGPGEMPDREKPLWMEMSDQIHKAAIDRLEGLYIDQAKAQARFTDNLTILADASYAVKERMIDLLNELPSTGEVIGSAMFAFSPSAMLNEVKRAILLPVGDLIRGFGPKQMLQTAADGVTGIVRPLIQALSPVAFFGQVFAGVAQAMAPSLERLAPLFEVISRIINDGLAPVFEAILPVLEEFLPLISAIVNVLAPILEAIVPLISALLPVLEAMFPIIKALAVAFTYVTQLALNVAGAFSKAVGYIIQGFGWIIEQISRAVDMLPFVSARSAIKFAEGIQSFGRAFVEAGQRMWESAAAMSEARDKISKVDISDFEDSMGALARSARDVSEALSNVPSGYKVLLNLRRFQAVDPREAVDDTRLNRKEAEAATVQNYYTVENVTVNAKEMSGTEFVDMFLGELKRRSLAKYGTTTRWAEV